MATTPMATWLKRQRLRQHKRMSQQELADALGVSRPWISSIERGVLAKPAIEDCSMLADYFGAPLQDVLTTAGYPVATIATLRRQMIEAGGGRQPEVLPGGLLGQLRQVVREELDRQPGQPVRLAAEQRSEDGAGEAPDDQVDLARRRRHWMRLARGTMTTARAWRLAGYSAGQEGTLTSWEEGAGEPSEAQLRQLARAYRIDPALLLDPPAGPTDQDRLDQARRAYLEVAGDAPAERREGQRRRQARRKTA